ncbi:hypothetical protein Tco_1132474, partial [Tanacetum coccineum]
SPTTTTSVAIPSVERPWLFEAEGFSLPNHEAGRILPTESQMKVTKSSVNVTDSSISDYDSVDESLVYSTPLPSLEYLNRILVNFCDEKRISQNFFSPYTTKQNGVVERKNRTLIEAARSMLSGSIFSKQYRTEAVVNMDDPNITMEEYIRLEEEKARRHVIVLNDMLTPEVTLSCEHTVSPLNDNKIDFRILFDESDDEDYMVIYDKNSFSYKIIFVDDLKMNSENDNEKVNMPLFPSPEHTVSYFDDLDYFKDFEKEFPSIVYNDALTSKSDFLTEPTVSPQHIDELNLKDETSLSEYDEEKQNVLYFNSLFPFNVIYPDDLKSDKDNDDDKFNIKQSSGGNVINTDDGAYAQMSNKLLETSHDTSNKFFKTKTFIKDLNFNIMTWNHLNKGMSFIFLIKNLYVPFGIPFDPKLFYKDGIKLGQV